MSSRLPGPKSQSHTTVSNGCQVSQVVDSQLATERGLALLQIQRRIHNVHTVGRRSAVLHISLNAATAWCTATAAAARCDIVSERTATTWRAAVVARPVTTARCSR